MLGVDECDDTSHGLRLSQNLERECGLARGLGAIDLDDAATGHATNAQGGIERKRPCGDGLNFQAGAVITVAHDGALTELLLYLLGSDLERLVALLCGLWMVDLFDRSLALGHARSSSVGFLDDIRTPVRSQHR